jgi:hypothetical protein
MKLKTTDDSLTVPILLFFAYQLWPERWVLWVGLVIYGLAFLGLLSKAVKEKP